MDSAGLKVAGGFTGFFYENKMQIKDELRKPAHYVEKEHVDDHFVEILFAFVELLHLFLVAVLRIESKLLFRSDISTNDANKHDIDDGIKAEND